MYGFLRSPKWILGHVLVVVAVAAFLTAGLWQLDRRDARREENALVAERSTGAPVPIDELLGEHGEDPAALAYRAATVTGRYAVADEVVVTGRSFDGAPGMHVLTPLVTDEGRTVVVDRGWVPYEAQPDPPITAALPPQGEITVTGVLFPDQPGARSGPEGAGSGEIDYMTSVDLGLVATPELPPLVPVHLAITAQDPPGGPLPRAAEPPPLDEGPHLNYALQWFLFTGIALIGYPLLVWRTARDRRREATTDEPSVPTASASR